jgi:hypothetical protein
MCRGEEDVAERAGGDECDGEVLGMVGCGFGGEASDGGVEVPRFHGEDD